MKINDVKEELNKLQSVKFLLPNGSVIPEHFHVTEVGIISKNFIAFELVKIIELNLENFNSL